MRALLFLAALIAVPAAAQTPTVPTPLPNVTTPTGVPRGVTPTFPLNVGVTLADCSGTIATANATQAAVAQNPRRQILIVQNPTDAAGRLFVDFDRAAGAGTGSVELSPGGTILVVGPPTPVSAINVASATIGARFVCKQG